ncbi:MAG: hypothetical protein OXG24_06105 [Gammaproteobacteria bacterium]|nr:hypothetical protein [Gammaproteobacteria bacterium]
MSASDASTSLDEILCSARSTLDSEEARLFQARQAIPDIATQHDNLLSDLYKSLHSSPTTALQTVRYIGCQLLDRTLTPSSSGASVVDDRPLYWTRLMGLITIRHALSNRGSSRRERIFKACKLFESESRNLPARTSNSLKPDKDPIVLSCFDPFNLDNNLAQSNPSAVVALTLAHETILGHPLVVLIFPVRYDDFDAGIVEETFEPIFCTSNRLVLTISMGRNRFDLERFPGRRRSSKAPDNKNRIGLVNGKPAPSTDGPEFLEFTLPALSMTEVKGDWSVVDNRCVTTLETGELHADSLDELADKTAFDGSGGGFLSNEISYRSRLLHRDLGAQIPLGHLHVPRISNFDSTILSNMTSQTRALIVAALESSK